jgi:hypothetical protein
MVSALSLAADRHGHNNIGCEPVALAACDFSKPPGEAGVILKQR